jgi:hypothetical protein
MFRAPAESYPAISKELAVAFELVPAGPVTAGLDLVVREYRRGDAVIDLAWDNWSGFFVTARSAAAGPLVGEIGTYLLASPWGRAPEPAP